MTDTTADAASTAGRHERTRIERYDPSAIEPRWQQRWEELELYRTDLEEPRNRYYLLTMYPYPSGDIHIGHWYIKTPTDAIARFRRMHGKNVFLPIGFDAFGLPAENAAIKNRINPRDWTMSNIANMRRQLRQMGATFDWSAEVVTCDPDYYSWNQWFFLQFLKAGLAYRAKSPVDWCPNDGTLAREQVEGADRHCWRCGAKVEKRDLDQWYLRVTKYADELLDFSEIQFPEPIRHPADELDRAVRGRRDRVRHGAVRPPRGRRGAARLHDAAGHAVRGDVHGPRPGAPAGRGADRPGPARGGRGVRRARRDRDRDRAAVDGSREDRRADRRRRDQPGQRRADPDLRRRLRAGRLRHGRDHGRPRARRARLRVRAEVRAADPAGRRAAGRGGRRSRRGVRRPLGRRGAGQQRRVQRAAGRRGRAADRRRRWRQQGKGKAGGHLPPARLADQPPALLGHADPGHPLPDPRHRAGPRRGPAGPAARHRRLRGQRA